MTTKLLIAGVLLLAISFFLIQTTQVKTDNAQDIVIETVGLNELNIQLESPYGALSPHHVLLVNNSPHHLLACEIVFNWISQDGKVYPAKRIIAYGDLLEANPVTRQNLLKSSLGISPRSKMLVGLGVEPDLVRVTNKLPPVGKANIDQVLNDSIKFEKLMITLNAVVLETGEAVGPGAQEFLFHLKNSVLQEQRHEK